MERKTRYFIHPKKKIESHWKLLEFYIKRIDIYVEKVNNKIHSYLISYIESITLRKLRRIVYFSICSTLNMILNKKK